MTKINRRKFVKSVSGIALGASVFPLTSFGKVENRMPKRMLGRTGEMVSLISIGGFHVGASKVAEEDAIEIMRKSVDMGVNFFDNAWSYQKGRSEELMGRALQDGYRKKVLLMTKLMARSVEEAKVQMETSLNRFGMDSVDLVQFHAIGYRDDDVDKIYGGLIDWAEEQRSQGVFKYIGFTGHSDPKAMLDMIERGYPWDTVQLPLNIGDYNRNMSFEKHVLPLAIENNIGIIGMKSNGMGKLGDSGIASPVEGLQYSMSLPVSTVVSGIDSLEILEENLAFTLGFGALNELQKNELRERGNGQSDIIEGYRRKFYDENLKLKKA